MTAVESLSVLHHIADYIMQFILDHLAIVVSLKMYTCTLEGLSNVVNFITAYKESQ